MMDQQIFQWITLGVLAAFYAFDKAKDYFSKNGNSKNSINNSYKRSYHPMLMDHEKRITINEQGIKALCNSINDWKKDNKEDHKSIFEKLDKLADRVK